MRNVKNSKKDKRAKRDTDQVKKRLQIYIMTISIALFLSMVLAISIFTYPALYKSDYFLIKESRIDWLAEPLARGPYQGLSGIGAGQNIFKFDIKPEATRILSSHPELKNAKITKDFPDRLNIKIEPRLPVAQVGENSFFLVDKEGVVLTEIGNSIREGLPIISGIGWRPFRKIGQRENSRRMLKALSLLGIMKDYGFLDEHTLAKIDISDYRNISFFIEDGLEVKIGHSDFKERLGTLDKTLKTMAVDKSDIKYIDLRFDDVVLGTR